jgi:protein-S-isoprenylcysteine O-methyltransferase Ste14
MTLGMLMAVAFAIGWIPFYRFRAESMRDALPYYRGSERRWVQLSPALFAIHMTLASLLLSVSSPPRWRAGLGTARFAAALAFWLWARRQIGPWQTTRLPDDPPRRLRRDGAFGVVRNPLYLAYLLAAAGPALVAARPVLAVTLAACAAALMIRAAQEERRLHAQLGTEYAEYCRRVKRLIPYVW